MTSGAPGRPGRLRWAGCWVVAVAIVAACGANPPPPASSTVSATSVPTSAALPTTAAPAPAGPCADDQPGRYVSEIFEPAELVTTTYTDDLKVDVYAPGDDPATCRVGVVWVHGGGFTQASRDSTAERAWGRALARRGFVVASIDYTLGQGEPFGLDQATDPGRQAVVATAITQARAALGWLRQPEPGLAVDPERVAIGGTSAGAMIALGAALTAPAAEQPCGVVSISGDLDPAWVRSPVPVALVVHGDDDDLVPYRSAVDAVDALTAAGGSADLVTIGGAGHEITGPPTPELVTTVAGWLAEHVAAGCR